MVIGGMKLVRLTLSLNQISPGMKIPMGYVYLVLPLSGLLMILYSTGFIVQSVIGSQSTAEHQISALD
jgi:TRAP-type C4-dicarboxylate transport system permease small subunit